MTNKREFISVKTAAMEVEFKPKWIREKCRIGEIPAKQEGGEYRIERTVWEEWKSKKLGTAS